MLEKNYIGVNWVCHLTLTQIACSQSNLMLDMIAICVCIIRKIFRKSKQQSIKPSPTQFNEWQREKKREIETGRRFNLNVNVSVRWESLSGKPNGKCILMGYFIRLASKKHVKNGAVSFMSRYKCSSTPRSSSQNSCNNLSNGMKCQNSSERGRNQKKKK